MWKKLICNCSIRYFLGFMIFSSSLLKMMHEKLNIAPSLKTLLYTNYLNGIFVILFYSFFLCLSSAEMWRHHSRKSQHTALLCCMCYHVSYDTTHEYVRYYTQPYAFIKSQQLYIRNKIDITKPRKKIRWNQSFVGINFKLIMQKFKNNSKITKIVKNV